MKLIPTEAVNSSNIQAIGYDEPSRTLQVDFHGGAAYQYTPITNKAFLELKNADSVGSHFAKHIKDNKLVTFIKVREKIKK